LDCDQISGADRNDPVGPFGRQLSQLDADDPHGFSLQPLSRKVMSHEVLINIGDWVVSGRHADPSDSRRLLRRPLIVALHWREKDGEYL
jgi:hypothetical protein